MDRLDHATLILENFCIPEPKNTVALGHQKPVTFSIMLLPGLGDV